ncbi:peroxidase 63-like [Abrus precatorius]|uniref:Peroxidase n=1 Tax=Abrus precatorius TaxID=3816 RepID=A0A8B8KX66_ABRPR|nr:peroxidase 63-like [Abrus precatorius]
MAYNNPFLFLFLFISISSLPLAQPELTTNYYQKSCPKFSEIVQTTVSKKQSSTPATAAATLRLFFHDCMVGGCDASILVTSNSFNTAERDADVNLSLGGDGFNVVMSAKIALELECPGVVSCADILATAARDLVVAAGGPSFELRLGRKDGLESKATSSENQFPLANMAMSQVISIFASKGISIQEMVALVGAHTIGYSHCKEFSNRIFNFSENSEIDPAYNPAYASGLRKLCENFTKDRSMSAFNDVMTPFKFDNVYYKNLQRGMGLLGTDSGMFADKRTKPFVDMYAANQTRFFLDFARAMEKVSVLQVKTGSQGEVRHRCDSFNSLNN